jgi:hypothetical protein
MTGISPPLAVQGILSFIIRPKEELKKAGRSRSRLPKNILLLSCGQRRKRFYNYRKLKYKGGRIMAKMRVVTFECRECGSEVAVTATGEVLLSPIYCCGVEVTETTSGVSRQAKSKKQITNKTTKKTAPKKVTQKKKPSPKKK